MILWIWNTNLIMKLLPPPKICYSTVLVHPDCQANVINLVPYWSIGAEMYQNDQKTVHSKCSSVPVDFPGVYWWFRSVSAAPLVSRFRPVQPQEPKPVRKFLNAVKFRERERPVARGVRVAGDDGRRWAANSSCLLLQCRFNSSIWSKSER